MELNKIIRRTGIPHTALYAKFVADLTEVTKDITGMTKEEVKETKDADGTVKAALGNSEEYDKLVDKLFYDYNG